MVMAAVLIGVALGFGGLAWLATLLVVMLLGALVDGPGFYGTAPPPRPR